jgi:hypothetical protein
VSDGVLCAVLRDEFDALDADTALAVRYAQAAVTRAPQLSACCEAVQARWGARGLATLALAVTGVRMFPMLKYALGHGQACVRVQVGAQVVNPAALHVHV